MGRWGEWIRREGKKKVDRKRKGEEKKRKRKKKGKDDGWVELAWLGRRPKFESVWSNSSMEEDGLTYIVLIY